MSDQNPETKKKVNLIRLIQSWNRFILHQLHAETLEARKKKILEMERKRHASESPRGHGNQVLKYADYQVGATKNEEWSRHVRGKSHVTDRSESDGSNHL